MELPQDWAAMQNNLGAAFHAQAGRSQGAEAVRLLDDAVSAYREALRVYTKEHSAHYHGVVARNLQQAESQLKELRVSSP